MIVAYWIVASLTALAFLVAGGLKLARPKEALAAQGMGWVDDFPDGSHRLISLAEVLGAVGLILPMLTRVAAVLSPIAGLCLAALMTGAVVTHLRRHEPPFPPLVLGLLAGVAAVLGFLVLRG